MKRIHRFSLFSFLSIVLFFVVSTSVYAAEPWEKSGCVVRGVATIQCLVPLFKNTLTAVLQLASVGLFIMLVVAGFSFLTGGGNPKQMEQAKNTVTYAIIGIVVIVGAYLIIQIIGAFTGVTDLGTFRVPAVPSPIP